MNTFRLGILWVLVALVLAGAATAQPKFYRDDPLKSEAGVDVPAKPAEVKLSDLYDRLRHTFEDRDENVVEAQNVNTLDEVPDSEWFTNRSAMSLEQLTTGPDRGSGPSTAGPWLVIEGKSEGLTPGFEIVDAAGDRYVIKLDPVDIPELNSAAEVIATKLFHAFGYNVPENTIVWFDPDSLEIEDGAEFLDRFGKPMKLTRARLGRMLERVPRVAGGKVRATASKFVDGEPLGPFRYYGTRSDDPNDVVPHEDRRELRGLRLFAAWLNHDDARAQNTLDAWVEEDGRRYVRHHLIDFGSTFGSGTVDLQLPNLSFHYWWDGDLIKKNALGLGLHVPKYRKVEWPNYSEISIRRAMGVDLFRPGRVEDGLPEPGVRADDAARRVLGVEDHHALYTERTRSDRVHRTIQPSGRSGLLSRDPHRTANEGRSLRSERREPARRLSRRRRSAGVRQSLGRVRVRHAGDVVPYYLVGL